MRSMNPVVIFRDMVDVSPFYEDLSKVKGILIMDKTLSLTNSLDNCNSPIAGRVWISYRLDMGILASLLGQHYPYFTKRDPLGYYLLTRSLQGTLDYAWKHVKTQEWDF